MKISIEKAFRLGPGLIHNWENGPGCVVLSLIVMVCNVVVVVVVLPVAEETAVSVSLTSREELFLQQQTVLHWEGTESPVLSYWLHF